MVWDQGFKHDLVDLADALFCTFIVCDIMCNSRLHGHTRLHGCMLDHDTPTAKINYHTCTKIYNIIRLYQELNVLLF